MCNMLLYTDVPSKPLNLTVLPVPLQTILLSWETPSRSSACVTSYNITTNTTSPSITTNTSVLVTQPPGTPGNSTYFVSIVAVDTGERMGPPASIDCLRFGGKFSGVIVLYLCVYRSH